MIRGAAAFHSKAISPQPFEELDHLRGDVSLILKLSTCDHPLEFCDERNV